MQTGPAYISPPIVYVSWPYRAHPRQWPPWLEVGEDGWEPRLHDGEGVGLHVAYDPPPDDGRWRGRYPG